MTYFIRVYREFDKEIKMKLINQCCNIYYNSSITIMFHKIRIYMSEDNDIIELDFQCCQYNKIRFQYYTQSKKFKITYFVKIELSNDIKDYIKTFLLNIYEEKQLYEHNKNNDLIIDLLNKKFDEKHLTNEVMKFTEFNHHCDSCYNKIFFQNKRCYNCLSI